MPTSAVAPISDGQQHHGGDALAASRKVTPSRRPARPRRRTARAAGRRPILRTGVAREIVGTGLGRTVRHSSRGCGAHRRGALPGAGSAAAATVGRRLVVIARPAHGGDADDDRAAGAEQVREQPGQAVEAPSSGAPRNSWPPYFATKYSTICVLGLAGVDQRRDFPSHACRGAARARADRLLAAAAAQAHHRSPSRFSIRCAERPARCSRSRCVLRRERGDADSNNAEQQRGRRGHGARAASASANA